MSTARLTSTGVIFPDSSILNSKYGIVPQSSTSIFYQASSPIGWVQNNSYNSYALRVVQSGGGGSGGSSSFTSVFSSYSVSNATASVPGSVDSTFIGVSETPSHGHGLSSSQRVTGGGALIFGPGFSLSNPNTTSAGSGGSHNHPFSASITYGYSFNIQIRYIDAILCSFS